MNTVTSVNNENVKNSDQNSQTYPSLMGLYYLAMLEMMKLDQQQMQAWLEYTKKMAAAYGGTDGGEGLLKMQLDYAFQSADSQSEATKTEALGYLCAAGIGTLALVGVGISAYKMGTGDLENQVKNHDSFETALNQPSDAELIMNEGEEDLSGLSAKQLQEKIQVTKAKIEEVDEEIEALNLEKACSDTGQFRHIEIDQELIGKKEEGIVLTERLRNEESQWLRKRFEELAEDRQAMRDFMTTNSQGIHKQTLQEHLKLDPEMLKKVKANSTAVRGEVEKEIQHYRDTHSTHVRYSDMFNNMGGSVAQGSAKTASAVPQSEGAKSKAVLDVQQTLNQSIAQTINTAQSSASDAKGKADNDAAAYAQVGK